MILFLIFLKLTNKQSSALESFSVTSEDGKKVNKLLSDNISLIKNKLTNIEII